jgi:hypothetical protein
MHEFILMVVNSPPLIRVGFVIGVIGWAIAAVGLFRELYF